LCACHKPSHRVKELTNAFVRSCRSSPRPRSVVVERPTPLAVCADCVVSTLAGERSVACRHTALCRVPVALAAAADRQVRQRVESTVIARFTNKHQQCQCQCHTHTHSHTHPFNYRVSRYQKGKTNLNFTEARDSEWQWHQLGHMQVCTSRQHPTTQFLQAGCPSCRPTNSVKALKASVNSRFI